MRSVLLTMSFAGTLTFLCCVLFFRLFGKSQKAGWRRALLLISLSFYLFPLPYFKYIMLVMLWVSMPIVFDIVLNFDIALSDHILQIDNSIAVFIDAAGQRFYSEAQIIRNVIGGLFFAVAAIILLYHFANDILVKKSIRMRSSPAGEEEAALLLELKGCMGVRRRIRLAQSEFVSIPVVTGIFTPVILLPKKLCADNSALRGMLLHELAHIKHWDILLQWLCLFAVALHWFNPCSYLLFHLLTEANEQYSDTMAVKLLNDQEKFQYCEDLINYSEQADIRDSSLVVLGFSKSAKKQIKNRIDEILNKKCKRLEIALCAGVLAVLMGTAAAFTYQQPITMSDSLPDNIDQEMLLDQDVEVYFKSFDPQSDSETSIPDLFQQKQED